MPAWTAEIIVDEYLARSLLAEQFTDLDLNELRLVGEGWDNTVWLVDERIAFRFPRRQIAIPGVEREIAVLPRLAPHLPLPVPTPTHVGRPADDYPWPFFGAPFLTGRELGDAAPPDETRVRLAAPLGAFLHALHTSDAVDPEALPADPNRRTDMPFRVARVRDALAALAWLGLWRAPGSVERLLDEASKLQPAEPSALGHGDLHFRHLLVDGEGTLSGVIDWGDVCRADPSIDLSVAWSAVPPSGRGELLAAYGSLTDEQLLRARVLAFSLSAMLALYAHHDGLERVEGEAVAGLTRAATD